MIKQGKWLREQCGWILGLSFLTSAELDGVSRHVLNRVLERDVLNGVKSSAQNELWPCCSFRKGQRESGKV